MQLWGRRVFSGLTKLFEFFYLHKLAVNVIIPI